MYENRQHTMFITRQAHAPHLGVKMMMLQINADTNSKFNQFPLLQKALIKLQAIGKQKKDSMALFMIVFSLNMFDKMIETINNVKPIKKLYFFIIFVIYYFRLQRYKVLKTLNVSCMLGLCQILFVLLHNMKVNGYKNLTIATIFAVFLLQTIWLYNSFSVAVNKLTTEVNDFFIQCLFEELDSRFTNIPPDTQIQGSNKSNPKYDNYEYINNGISLVSR